MMKYYFYLFTIIIIVFLVSGCADLEENLTQPRELTFHKEGIINPHSDNFHGELVKDNNWDMKECQGCHAADFSGGTADASCLNCHTAPAGPASCNTCHGVFSDPSRPAPPKDINDNTSTDIKSVGAHSIHLYENKMSSSVPCESCHKVPQSLYEAGHVDSDLPSEVILKNTATAFGAADASYNSANGTCSNTYCHGNFEFYRDSAASTNRFAYTADKMVGISNTVDWTKIDGSQTQCGSCHGLPPVGHIAVPITDCYTCHDIMDQQGNIIDKSRHINGVKNSRGDIIRKK